MIVILKRRSQEPWLFEKIYQELQGYIFTPPNLAEIGHIFLRHVQGLMELDGERIALLESRKLGKYYARHHLNPNHILFLQEISQVRTYADLTRIVNQYFLFQ